MENLFLRSLTKLKHSKTLVVQRVHVFDYDIQIKEIATHSTTVQFLNKCVPKKYIHTNTRDTHLPHIAIH